MILSSLCLKGRTKSRSRWWARRRPLHFWTMARWNRHQRSLRPWDNRLCDRRWITATLKLKSMPTFLLESTSWSLKRLKWKMQIKARWTAFGKKTSSYRYQLKHSLSRRSRASLEPKSFKQPLRGLINASRRSMSKSGRAERKRWNLMIGFATQTKSTRATRSWRRLVATCNLAVTFSTPEAIASGAISL